jgi:hypothetical protein
LIPTSPPSNVVTIAPGMLSPFNLSSHLYHNIHGSLISNSPKNDGNFTHQLVSFGPSIEKNANQMREQQTTSRYVPNPFNEAMVSSLSLKKNVDLVQGSPQQTTPRLGIISNQMSN